MKTKLNITLLLISVISFCANAQQNTLKVNSKLNEPLQAQIAVKGLCKSNDPVKFVTETTTPFLVNAQITVAEKDGDPTIAIAGKEAVTFPFTLTVKAISGCGYEALTYFINPGSNEIAAATTFKVKEAAKTEETQGKKVEEPQKQIAVITSDQWNPGKHANNSVNNLTISTPLSNTAKAFIQRSKTTQEEVKPFIGALNPTGVKVDIGEGWYPKPRKQVNEIFSKLMRTDNVK